MLVPQQTTHSPWLTELLLEEMGTQQAAVQDRPRSHRKVELSFLGTRMALTKVLRWGEHTGTDWHTVGWSQPPGVPMGP